MSIWNIETGVSLCVSVYYNNKVNILSEIFKATQNLLRCYVPWEHEENYMLLKNHSVKCLCLLLQSVFKEELRWIAVITLVSSNDKVHLKEE